MAVALIKEEDLKALIKTFANRIAVAAGKATP
jgi:hypothetical protein